MAVLSAAELQVIRNGVAATSGLPINYTKTQINAMAQAVEDFLTNNAPAIANAMKTAVSPYVPTAAQMKAIGAWTEKVKYERDK